MEILSRGQLATIIKENKVDNSTGVFEGKLASFTTVHNKKNDSFYRIIWGKVIDGDESHIWFNRETEEVTVAPNGEWMTKCELREYRGSLRIEEGKPFDELPLMKTKCLYSFKNIRERVSSLLVENKRVLFISTERLLPELTSEIFKTLAGDSYESLRKDKANLDNLNDLCESTRLIKKMEVNHVSLLNTNKIREIIRSNKKFDLIVIDNIKFNNDTYEDVSKLIDYIDNIAQDSNCEVLIYARKL